MRICVFFTIIFVVYNSLQVSDSLHVTRQAISRSLHELGKIRTQGRWVPHPLTQCRKKSKEPRAET